MPLSKSAGENADGFTRGRSSDFYKKGEELGKGGCATVYRAVELATGQVSENTPKISNEQQKESFCSTISLIFKLGLGSEASC